jgi:acetyl-CoA carboxylase biotin carboxyl carrier protein
VTRRFILAGAEISEIRAEIVGTVLKVLADAGSRIGAGQSVVLLESMKMEIPVVAESAGRILSVEVCEGDFVREGDLLAVVA